MRFPVSILILFYSLGFYPLHLVSCDTLLDALYQLINEVEVAKKSAYLSISQQYNQVIKETDEELYGNIIPTLTDLYNNISEYINNLENETTSLGYDFTSCETSIEETLANASSISNILITTKAIEEKQFIYDQIINNVLFIGRSKLNIINAEISTITDEYYVCLISLYPEFCNGTLYTKVLQKQEEIPVMYEKESQMTNLNLIQQGMEYKNLIQDYVQEATRGRKLYVSFLESCLQRLVGTS